MPGRREASGWTIVAEATVVRIDGFFMIEQNSWRTRICVGRWRTIASRVVISKTTDTWRRRRD